MCRYCGKNAFEPLNTTTDYSGLEIAMSGRGVLRVRNYNFKEVFETQDAVDIDYCPMCRKEAGRVIVLGIILMILSIGMLAIVEYNQGCKDTERAYQTRNCDKCANWKTINCPNSSKCFSTVDKPYFKIRSLMTNEYK